MLVLDKRQVERQQADAMRLALLSTNPELARGLYPEYFEPVEEIVDETGEIALDQENTDYDFSRVEWQSPKDLGDPEMDMLRKMLGNQDIIVRTPVEPPEEVEENLRLNSEPDNPKWI